MCRARQQGQRFLPILFIEFKIHFCSKSDLEDAHLIVATEDSGLDVVSTFDALCNVSSSNDFSSFFFANREIFLDLLKLLLRSLCTNLRLHVKRVTNLDHEKTRD